MQLRLSRNFDAGRIQRAGKGLFALGFLFFLLKGLLWLAVGGLVFLGVF